MVNGRYANSKVCACCCCLRETTTLSCLNEHIKKLKPKNSLIIFMSERANEHEIEIQDRDGEWESMSVTTANHTINEHRHRYVYIFPLLRCPANSFEISAKLTSAVTHAHTHAARIPWAMRTSTMSNNRYASLRKRSLDRSPHRQGGQQLWWWRRSYAPMEYLSTTNERCSKYDARKNGKNRCVYWKYPMLVAWPKPRWAHTKFESIRLRTCSRLS